MYCILITGIPASGKSTMAKYLAEELKLPAISKDEIKELLYDSIGFRSRAEKVKLGIGSMNIMYYMAEQMMKCRQPFLLENNFENLSREGILSLLETYGYTAITVTLTGDYRKIYQRFLERNNSQERHRGHVVNECYPEEQENPAAIPIPYDAFVSGIENRGMDQFAANGPHIVVDTTNFDKVDRKAILNKIVSFREAVLSAASLQA